MIELLVVISIILILAGIVTSASVFIRRKAKYTRTAAQLSALEVALEQHNSEHGYFPLQPSSPATSPSTANLELEFGTIDNMKNSNGVRYISLSTLPLFSETDTSNSNAPVRDAYLNPFFYRFCTGPNCAAGHDNGMNTELFDLWSMGADGKHGTGGSSWTDAMTTDVNDDITNWKPDR